MQTIQFMVGQEYEDVMKERPIFIPFFFYLDAHPG